MNTLIVKKSVLASLAAEVVRRGGDLSFRARGFSMRPAILNRAKVTISPVRASRLKVGQIVFARTQTGPRVHRVVALGCDLVGPYLVLLGDSDVGSGQRVRHGDVIGVVTKIDGSRIAALLDIPKFTLRNRVRAIVLRGLIGSIRAFKATN